MKAASYYGNDSQSQVSDNCTSMMCVFICEMCQNNLEVIKLFCVANHSLHVANLVKRAPGVYILND